MRFDRVMSIALPGLNLQPGMKIKVDKLLDVRASSELREFRDWLVTIDSLSDAEIREQVASMRARLGVFAQSTAGKTIRFALGATTSLMSGHAGVIIITGLAVSALDQFLIDRVLPRRGITAFVTELYPSLFEQDATGDRKS